MRSDTRTTALARRPSGDVGIFDVAAKHHQSIQSPRLVNCALGYAARGLPVFPCRPGAKEPATKHGFHDATTDPATIRRWWSTTDCNVGISTGADLIVLDVDGDAGADSLLRLQAEHGSLPRTATVATANGVHMWFAGDGEPVPNSTSKIAPHVDIRGDGGYVIAPPSIHPNGTVYRWADRLPLAPAPAWLLDLARLRPEPTISERALAGMRRSSTGSNGYGNAALRGEIVDLASAPVGQRNAALNKASFRLHQLVAGGELDGAEVAARLIDASHANRLVADDGFRAVLATIASGRRAGLACPRRRAGQ